ncbi:hypothetical protein Dsin_021726 [Dipteronia sinensis]|uniref:Uncharacterized protein n=1 Tax=Dipteronia sinensis TaxID=43782 RepID=A0AAE0DZA9_9ROSI|nr:hypothetical protein Dsin_021726 [Dipteronia sinensis]
MKINIITLTGSAAIGGLGPVIGRVDVRESKDSYLFGVALPPLVGGDSEFKCFVYPTGKVSIREMSTIADKTVRSSSKVFEILNQNVCLPEPFSITFHMPGRIVVDELYGYFGTDGTLKAIVKKEKRTTPAYQP